MKLSINLALCAALGLWGSVAFGQTIIQDFEGGTAPANLPGAWAPDFSGTSYGADGGIASGATDIAQYSTEQKNGGNQSGKLQWDWLADKQGKIVRIQPNAGFNNATLADRTATSFYGLALYGNNQLDKFQIYMSETGPGAGAYEKFTAEWTVDWVGWQVVERKALSTASGGDPVSGWVNGDGALNNSNSPCGFFWVNSSAAARTVTYYVDDIQYSATSRKTIDPDTAGVNDWSVY